MTRRAASKRVLICDIDGTLLDHGASTVGLGTLRFMLEARRDRLRLVYATGRSFASTWTLVRMGILPEPDAVAAFVGTEVWLPPWKMLDTGYMSQTTRDWNPEVVRRIAARFQEAVPQHSEFQTSSKASYHLASNRQQIAKQLRAALSAAGVYSRVIHSGGRYLDIIPGRAGKRQAVQYILRRWGCEDAKVLTCGDSGNDMDLLEEPEFFGVIVGNSEDPTLQQLAQRDNLYKSRLPFAAGVLEGTVAHSFWLQ